MRILYIYVEQKYTFIELRRGQLNTDTSVMKELFLSFDILLQRFLNLDPGNRPFNKYP
jgi:hypothetical protein